MWRKSSRSADTNCVEVRNDLAALRDSKRPAAALSARRAAVAALVAFARGR
jgi:uncharacterized protein DUF397